MVTDGAFLATTAIMDARNKCGHDRMDEVHDLYVVSR
jgi:hypothetical protein